MEGALNDYTLDWHNSRVGLSNQYVQKKLLNRHLRVTRNASKHSISIANS